MFTNIDESILMRMKVLEEIDQDDRSDGTDRMQRLRQISPETGRFLAILAASAPAGDILEIGTSAGYSTLWLSLAAQMTNRRIVTYEILPEKIALAKKTFKIAAIEKVVTLVHGDALDKVPNRNDYFSFCFLDAEKEVYLDCYELVIPKLPLGGIFVADNTISHKDDLKSFIDRTLSDERVDAVEVPIGSGVMVCRKI